MNDLLGLRHVALNVRDIRTTAEFYQRVLRMKLEWQPDPENVYLTSGQDNLALHSVSDRTDAGPGFRALDHIGFVVRRPEDVDSWAEQVQSQGVVLERPPRTHRDGARSFYFQDPEGNTVQIIYHPPISDRS